MILIEANANKERAANDSFHSIENTDSGHQEMEPEGKSLKKSNSNDIYRRESDVKTKSQAKSKGKDGSENIMDLLNKKSKVSDPKPKYPNVSKKNKTLETHEDDAKTNRRQLRPVSTVSKAVR